MSRTVALPVTVVPIVDRWALDKNPDSQLFEAPRGGPLSQANWRRSVGWAQAKKAIGRPRLRPHDLRHTAASLWLGVGADPKVVQRVLGHASATMTLDLYGHLIDQNLWDAARLLDDFGGSGGTAGAPRGHKPAKRNKGQAPDADAKGA